MHSKFFCSTLCWLFAGAVFTPTLAFAGENAISIWSFEQSGYAPAGGLVADRRGNLFGTTEGGGNGPCDGESGCGTVFELTQAATPGGKWHYKVLYNFQGGSDGGFPGAQLTIDPVSGTVYGYTEYNSGGGNVFSLTPPAGKSGTWGFQNIYVFTGGADGSLFVSTAPLLFAGGMLYGVAKIGGVAGCGENGCGTFFRLQPGPSGRGSTAWIEKNLISFSGKGASGLPASAVGPDSENAFYVATGWDHGAVYRVTLTAIGNATASAIMRFKGGNDGGPNNLVLGLNGDVYGLRGIGPGPTAVFQLVPPVNANSLWTYAEIAKVASHGYGPDALSLGSGGGLLGTIYGDVDFYPGNVFALTPPALGSTGPWAYREVWSFINGPDRNPINVVMGRGTQQTNLFSVLSGGDSGGGSVVEITGGE